MKLTTSDISDLVSIDNAALAGIIGGCGKRKQGGGGCQTACASAQVMAAAPVADPGVSVQASYSYNGATTSASATA